MTFKFDFEDQGQSPQKKGDRNQVGLHLWSKFDDPSLNGWWVIAQTSSELTHTHTHTHTHADAGNGNSRRPNLASVKTSQRMPKLIGLLNGPLCVYNEAEPPLSNSAEILGQWMFLPFFKLIPETLRTLEHYLGLSALPPARSHDRPLG